jgi:GMP synthase-like glutamine amidotransferase
MTIWIHRTIHVDPTTGRSSIVDSESEGFNGAQRLRFVMLACEPQEPYGPPAHTGRLFAQLLAESWIQAALVSHLGSDHVRCHLSIHVYNVQQGEYPSEWSDYQGVLLPGSFASAYDDRLDWIAMLIQVIQKHVVAQQRPTLAVCFGHQILAHSFGGNAAAVQPMATKRGGRYVTPLTTVGQGLLSKESLQLFYTHGDMVTSLPPVAVPLAVGSLNDCTAGTPIQMAAYFATAQEALQVQQAAQQDGLPVDSWPRPHAISFQAHPEYAPEYTALSSNPAASSLNRLLESMVSTDERGWTERQCMSSLWDAQQSHAVVNQDSVYSIMIAGQLLGWFPK